MITDWEIGFGLFLGLMAAAAIYVTLSITYDTGAKHCLQQQVVACVGKIK